MAGKAHALSRLQAVYVQTGYCLLHCARAFLGAIPKKASKPSTDVTHDSHYCAVKCEAAILQHSMYKVDKCKLGRRVAYTQATDGDGGDSGGVSSDTSLCVITLLLYAAFPRVCAHNKTRLLVPFDLYGCVT